VKHIILKDRFSDCAKELRHQFEKKLSTENKTNSNRFVWDYWYVKNQYQFLRTPAYHFFQEKIYSQFHSQLVQWGRENLGCHDVSPPWLSYYIDGMEQRPHSDVPHGPWAWVFSLSPAKKEFSGGETFIFKPQLLDYWNHFADEKNREQEAYMDFVSPDFNRLIVFDPRFPHGVTQVRGTQDPLQARLVIHGWFVEPRPYVVGGLTTEQVQVAIESVIFQVADVIQAQGDFHGTISLRMDVDKAGDVKKIAILTDTVLSLEANLSSKKFLNSWLLKNFRKVKFPKNRKSSQVTVPLLFK